MKSNHTGEIRAGSAIALAALCRIVEAQVALAAGMPDGTVKFNIGDGVLQKQLFDQPNIVSIPEGATLEWKDTQFVLTVPEQERKNLFTINRSSVWAKSKILPDEGYKVAKAA